MIDSFWSGLLMGSVHSGAPLLYATLAEIVDERAGIVNLGLEGVMLMGAVVGFAIDGPNRERDRRSFWPRRSPGGLFNLFFGFS